MKGTTLTRQVSANVSEAFYKELKEITDMEERSISEWIREAISMKLKQEGTNSIKGQTSHNQSISF